MEQKEVKTILKTLTRTIKPYEKIDSILGYVYKQGRHGAYIKNVPVKNIKHIQQGPLSFMKNLKQHINSDRLRSCIDPANRLLGFIWGKCWFYCPLTKIKEFYSI